MADPPRLLRNTRTVVGNGEGKDPDFFFKGRENKEKQGKQKHDGAAKKTTAVF